MPGHGMATAASALFLDKSGLGCSLASPSHYGHAFPAFACARPTSFKLDEIPYTPPDTKKQAEPRDKHEAAPEDYVDPDTYPENRGQDGEQKSCKKGIDYAQTCPIGWKYAPAGPQGPECQAPGSFYTESDWCRQQLTSRQVIPARLSEWERKELYDSCWILWPCHDVKHDYRKPCPLGWTWEPWVLLSVPSSPMLSSLATILVGFVVLHFYRARLRSWRDWFPHFIKTIQNWSVAEASNTRSVDPQVLASVHQKREKLLKETAGVWSVMIEAFWLPYFCVVNFCSWGDPSQLPCFLSGFVVVPALHKLAKPSVQLTASVMQQFTLSTYLAILLSSELMPILYVARIMLGSFGSDAQFSNMVNVLIAPLWVLSHWMQKDRSFCFQRADAETADLFYFVISEVITLGVTALAIGTLNDKEYEIAAANMQLEAKVREVEEAERSGAAAQRLLAVTCDASARILGPSHSLSDLLMCGFGASGSQPSLEGASFSRYVAAGDQQRLQDFVAESSQGDKPPRSMHLQMKDSSGISFNAELFHAKEHLIGISQEIAERTGPTELVDRFDRTVRTHVPAQSSDMRHMLGFLAASSFGGARVKRLGFPAPCAEPELGKRPKVNFVIDVQTLHDDFVLRSVKLSFKESQNASKSAMPNLLEWVRPNYRDKVYNWVQAHANAFYTGRE
eukprot:s4223_g4.t1